MSVIKLTLPVGEIPVNGKQVSFVAPCECTAVEALQIDGENYAVVDALRNCVTGKGGRWDVGSVVTVVLDVDNKYAYIQSPVSSITLTATVGTSWTANGGYYYQEISVPGILASDTPVVSVLTGSDNAANELYVRSMGKVVRIVAEENKITVWAKDSILSAFPIQMKVVR